MAQFRPPGELREQETVEGPLNSLFLKVFCF